MRKTEKNRVRVLNDGVKGFFGRARARARKLDRGERPEREIIISFEDAADMVRVLSSERLRLLRVARKHPSSVHALAEGLGRNARAVSRDVDLLEQFGLVESRYEANPGHGRRRIVEPRGAKYQLIATV